MAEDKNGHLFTVELIDKDQVEIHINQAGLQKLLTALTSLKGPRNLDTHLFSDEWGGESLTTNRQNPDSTIINHVKIMYWAK